VLEGVVVLDELKEEAIVNKVGGRFKLSTLIQKRMVQLNAGARALVEMKTHDKLAVVIQEILQEKIYLDPAGNVRERGGRERGSDRDPSASDGSDDEVG
jgi:DNA-directed RNA polymerase subunit omega